MSNIWSAVVSLPDRIAALTSSDAEQLRAIHGIQETLLSLSSKLDQIINLLSVGPADRFIITATLDGITHEGISQMTLSDSQKSTLTLKAVDAKGNPTTITGTPTWATSDPTVCTVTADDPTGMTATLVGVAPGTARVTADDLEVWGKDVTGILDVTVIGGAATTLSINSGTPVDQ